MTVKKKAPPKKKAVVKKLAQPKAPPQPEVTGQVSFKVEVTEIMPKRVNVVWVCSVFMDEEARSIHEIKLRSAQAKHDYCPHIKHSTGFLVDQSDESVFLALTYNTDEHTVEEVLLIPRQCVIEIRELRFK